MANVDKTQTNEENPAQKVLSRIREHEETASAPSQTREVVRTAEQRRERPRVRGNTFGGARLKLQVFGEIPGYKLIWENDLNGALQQLIQEGFEYVEPSELRGQDGEPLTQGLVADKSLDSRISRHAGTDDAGSPYRAYLMKYPLEWWDEREKENAYQADQWDKGVQHRFDLDETEEGFRKLKHQKSALDTKFKFRPEN